jgi:hypothetical protein
LHGVTGKILVEQLFPEDVGKFADDVCEAWESIQSILTQPEQELGLSCRVRRLPVTKGNNAIIVLAICYRYVIVQYANIIKYNI